MSNTDTVKGMYEAFGRGDIPTILDKLADDVKWDTDSATDGVPWLTARSGKSEVPAFFESLAPLEFTTFDPHTFFESGNKVFALVHIAGTSKASGKPFDIKNEGHLWEFASDGKVNKYDHITDTLTHLKMAKGE